MPDPPVSVLGVSNAQTAVNIGPMATDCAHSGDRPKMPNLSHSGAGSSKSAGSVTESQVGSLIFRLLPYARVFADCTGGDAHDIDGVSVVHALLFAARKLAVAVVSGSA